VGIDGGKPPRRTGQPGRTATARPPVLPRPSRGNKRHPEPLDGLFGEGAQVATVLLEIVPEVPMAALARPRRGPAERVDRFLFDQAEHLAHAVGRQASRIGREELIEHRLASRMRRPPGARSE